MCRLSTDIYLLLFLLYDLNYHFLFGVKRISFFLKLRQIHKTLFFIYYRLYPEKFPLTSEMEFLVQNFDKLL